MRRAGAVLLAATIAAAAQAQTPQQTTKDFASRFGTLIGSEAPCGLAYDVAAVTDAIRANVAAGDLGFAQTFNAYANLTRSQVAAMEGSQRAAHCLIAEQNARAMGLVR